MLPSGGLSKEVVPDGLLPHGNIAPWPELYAGESAGAGTQPWADNSDLQYWWTEEGARPKLVERIPGYQVGEDNDEEPQDFINLGITPPNRVLASSEVQEAVEASMAGGELDPRRKKIIFNKL